MKSILGAMCMVFDGILISILVGFFRKGNLKFLTKPLFKWGWIFPILLVVQFLIFNFQNDIDWIAQVSPWIFMSIYIIGLIFLWKNRTLKGFNFILIGVFLNFIVMFLNGGRMPVSEEAAVVLDPLYIDALKTELYGKHMLLTESTRLPFLGDIIPITSPYPKDQVISIGDVIMNIGIFLFIQQKMLENRKSSARTLEPAKGGVL